MNWVHGLLGLGLGVLVALLITNGGTDDETPRLDVLDRTVEGVTYRCLMTDEGGLWCTTVWATAEQSNDP